METRACIDAVTIGEGKSGVFEFGRAFGERFGERHAFEEAERAAGAQLDVLLGQVCGHVASQAVSGTWDAAVLGHAGGHGSTFALFSRLVKQHFLPGSRGDAKCAA